ncbi:MAG: hypothetical protein COT81_01480 [Candidatus Buchananbacteria bacterium CG10_big_fil_rev_8_21_14_0_10_42_9]|uniref:Segregation and condensation protein A n=1 Tax=Candidatus Buchananbacteria bacterium CG10_big_fil_rev_8_21_14_0_10_42_9 TaxID=1974526 RepID=A0A2H0W242_9BACT|nr:MAG: hypothetical protein COT81_01480 [Candidatus Buchananbacteria bacterium CG10_big_fil_rev_8_21_14_0_10_42_9]
MHQVKIEQFSGPLDLLLQLIEEQKLEITQVSLAEVTEQYIKTIYEAVDRQHIKPGELADFLAVASKLLLIKSKALLPYLKWEDEEAEDLERQLKIYQEYLEASKAIEKIIRRKKFGYGRERLLVTEEIGFNPPPSLSKSKLHQVMLAVLNNVERSILPDIPKETIKRTISIQQKIADIRNRILSSASLDFSKILNEAKDKTEIIVSFLAVLELIKQRTVTVEQDGLFTNITINKL